MQFTQDYAGPVNPGDELVNSDGDTVAVVGANGRARFPDGRELTVGSAAPPPLGVPDGRTNWGYEIPDPNDPGSSIVRPGGYGPGPEPTRPSAPGPLEEQRRRDREREQRDAFARLQSVLDEYGLGGLAGQVQAWLQDGLSEAEITQRMRDTQQFKDRFPAIEARKKAGLSALSPGEYVAYERQARQLMRAAGLPKGFYDGNDDFTGFLTGDVSLSELGDRVTMASRAAFDSDSAALEALARFGVTGGDLTAFFLDPEKAQPLLERKYNTSRLSATAKRSGFGFLEEQEAIELAQRGVTEAQAQQGFAALGEQSEFFTPLDGGEDAIGRADQLGAAFGGDAQSARRLRQRQRRRQASFAGGGSFAAGERGLSGLGEAPSV